MMIVLWRNHWKGVEKIYSKRVAFNMATLFVIGVMTLGPLAPAFAQSSTSSDAGAASSSGDNSAGVSTTPVINSELTSDSGNPSDAISSSPSSAATSPTSPTPSTPPPSPPPPSPLPPPAGGLGTPNPQPVISGAFDKDLLKIDNNTGAFHSNYPINIPPGRNGLQPNLSLVYNSQDNRVGSIVGEGWSINIPYIERINKSGVNNLYSTSSLNYFNSSLDSELVSTTTVTSTGSSYVARTDNGSFDKYAFSGSRWIMTDKNGIQYTFGSSTNSQQSDPNNASNIYRWMLEQVKDTNGNTINYNYFKDSGQIYPSSTIYTNTSSTTGIFEADFLRQSRSDTTTSSASGFGVSSQYLISEIDASVNGSWVRKYSLSYTAGNNASTSLLASIAESGRNASGTVVSLPSSTFSYQASIAGWTSSSTWTPPVNLSGGGTDSGVRVVDVNGDALSDIIYNDSFYGSAYADINNESGWTSSSTWVTPVVISNSGNGTEHKIADVNGDGLPDIVYRDSVFDSGTYINVGSGWISSSTWMPPVNLSCNGGDCGSRLVDVNGDGLPDIIYNDNTYGSPYAYINNGHGWTSNSSTAMWIPPVNISSGGSDDGTKLIDLNGDGLVDIIYNDSFYGSPFTYINNGHGWTLDSSWNSPVKLSCSGNTACTTLADINGDGLPDIIYSDPIGPTSGAYINNGHGWTSSSSWTPPVNLSSNGLDNGARVADVNGDGLPDIIYNDNVYGSPYGEINNNSVRTDLLTGIVYPQGGSSTIKYQSAAQFVSGTILNHIPYPVYVATQISTNDGSGSLSSSSYQYSGGIYYYNNAFDRELAGFNLVTTTDPAGNVTKTYYHTANGTDSTHGEYQDDFWKIGKPYRVEQYDNAGHLFKKTINKWDYYSLGGNAAFVKLDQTVGSSYDGLGTHKDLAEAYTYDNTNGNQTQKIQYGQVTGSDDGTFTDTGSDEYITNTTFATSTTGVIGLPSDVTLLNQSSTKIKESQFYYDSLALSSASLGNLTKEQDWKTASSYATIQNTYNGYGLVTTTLDPRNNTTTYAYDAYSLYPATTTNALSKAIKYQYDYSTGKPTQVTDPNGDIFQTTYDGLGRTLQILQPDQTTSSTLDTKTAYTYTDTANAVSVHEADYLTATTTVDTYSYYDGLGRLIQARKSAEDSGNYKVTDKTYNALGLAQKESLPYFASGSGKASATSTTALYTTYTYDPLQRPLTAVNGVGTTTYSYGNWNTTSTDPNGNLKNIADDAFGNLVQVNEHNSSSIYTTNYTYDGLKDLTNITDALGNIRNFTFDGLGRRLTAQDLHASADTTYGSSTFTYDDAGNLTQMVDAKNQTVNYTYDALNRISTEDYTGSTGTEFTYTYDTCTQGISRLCTVSSTDALVNNTYNGLGQLTQEVKTISSTTYTTSYAYDRQGNQVTITYPDNSQVQYIYNLAGLVESISQKPSGGSFTNVVSNFDYSPTDQPSTIAYANGVTATNTYDPAKLYRLTHKVGALPSGGGNAQDMSYTYDADGNITQLIDISNSGAGKTVNYTYDNLSRLTLASTANVSTTPAYAQAFTYDALGNILTGPAGTYAYNGNASSSYADPDAVTGITSLVTSAVTFDASSSFNMSASTSTITFPLTVTSTANRVLLVSVTGMPATETSTAATYNGSAMSKLVDNGNVNTRMQLWYLKNPASGTHNVSISLAIPTNIGLAVAASFANATSSGNVATSLSQGTSTSVSVSSTNGNMVVDFLNVLNGTQPNPTPTSGQTLLVASTTNGNFTQGALAYVAATGAGLVTDNFTLSTSSFWQQYEIELVAPSSTATSTNNFSYDNNGNLTSSHNSTSSWNYRNQLTQTISGNVTSTYAYDYVGNRVKLIIGSSTTVFPNMYYNTATGATSTVVTKNIFANGQLISTVQNNTTGSSAALLFDASSSYNLNISTTTLAFPLTVTSTANRVLLVGITGMPAANTSTAASYNGTAMSLLLDNSNANTRMQVWYLKNPASGAHTVSITIATSTNLGLAVAASFANASSSGNLASFLSQGTSTSVSVSSTNGNMMVDFLNVLNGVQPNPSATAGQTVLIASTTNGNFTQGAFAYMVATSSATMNERFTLSTSSFWQQYEIELVAATSTLTSSTNISYVLNDSLGGSNIVTNASGTVVETLDYYPYGSARIDTSPNQSQRKYVGQVFDPNTQLSYLNARYYNGTQGQFISQDPLFLALASATSTLQTLSDPQSLNAYSYGRDNPIVKSDPTGKYYDSLWFLSPQQHASVGLWLNGVAATNPFINFGLQHPYLGGLAIGVGAGAALAAGVALTGGAITCGVLCGSTVAAVGAGGDTEGNNLVNGATQDLQIESESVPASGEIDPAKFFKGTTDDESLSSKIDLYHSFPNLVRNFAGNGSVVKFFGGDGEVYFQLNIPGGYNGAEGSFEFIKDSNNIITHSFFNPN